MENRISIGIRDNILLIKIEGEMRAGNSFALSEVLPEYVSKVQRPLKVMIDLSGCTYMDSTSIGFIILLEARCRQYNAESVTIINPSESSMKHIKALSALHSLRIEKDKKAPDIQLFPLEVDSKSFNKKENIELMFDSHAILSQLSEENREEFGELLEELKKVLGN